MKQRNNGSPLLSLVITLLTTITALHGCGDTDVSDLQRFIEREKQNAQATNIDIKLYIRPKQFTYQGFDHRNPFNPNHQNTTTAIINNLRALQTDTSSNLCENQIPLFQPQSGTLTIDIERAKLRGFYRQGPLLYGLLVDVAGTVFKVTEGDVILSGQDYALVFKVTEGKITLQYYYQEAVDCWVKQLIIIES